MTAFLLFTGALGYLIGGFVGLAVGVVAGYVLLIILANLD